MHPGCGARLDCEGCEFDALRSPGWDRVQHLAGELHTPAVAAQVRAPGTTEKLLASAFGFMFSGRRPLEESSGKKLSITR